MLRVLTSVHRSSTCHQNQTALLPTALCTCWRCWPLMNDARRGSIRQLSESPVPLAALIERDESGAVFVPFESVEMVLPLAQAA